MDIRCKKKDLIGDKGATASMFRMARVISQALPEFRLLLKRPGKSVDKLSADPLGRDAKCLSDLFIRIGGGHTAGRWHHVVSDPCEHRSHVGGKK